MDVLAATDYLRRAMRQDADVKMMVSVAVTKGGHADLFDWAEASPDEVILLAEAIVDLHEQEDEFDRRLAEGDLS